MRVFLSLNAQQYTTEDVPILVYPQPWVYAQIPRSAPMHGGSSVIVNLAKRVVEINNKSKNNFINLYDDNIPLIEKIEIIAKKIYRADNVIASQSIRDQLKNWEKEGFGHFPICMAKTQYSFTTDPTVMGAPTNHSVPIKEVKLSAGAGFIVVICGDIMSMPGLPIKPSAEKIDINELGMIKGLF